MARLRKVLLNKIKFPTCLACEMSLFGGARAFQLVEAICNYGFKGIEPQKGDLDESQTAYYNEVLKPMIDKQKAEKRKKEMRKRYFVNAAKRNRSTNQTTKA